jgi:8-oxo-dGTP pyrophosphatase MutT (NUDIX family)
MQATARPAATILLLRDGPDGIEVFMVVRHHAIDFAGGALVFPGGRVEEADYELAARPHDCPNPDRLDVDALAFRVAAIRETFEECGVLLARPLGSHELIDAATLKRLEEQHRGALNAGSIGFDAVLGSEGLQPAPDLLVHFAHWITPASQAKRYDTQFFLAEAPVAHLAVHDGREAVESIWITPGQALADTEAGKYKLVFATAKNLEKLGQSLTVRDAMVAARGSEVVTVQPMGTKLDSGKRLMRIPAEAGYGGTEFIIDYMPASS